MTNYPNGVTSFGIPQLGSGDIPTGGGEYFFVSSVSGSNGYNGTWETPFGTLDHAVGKCTANKNSVIVILPNHAETITADSGVDIDVAGVTVVGLGNGDDRPTFTFTTAATADFKLAANNVTIKNLAFVAGVDALSGPIEVSADHCSIIDCEYFEDTDNNYETVDVIVTASTPLYLTIDGFRYVCDGGAGGTQNQSVIQLNGADFAVIRNCLLVADSATGVIEDATTSDQILIENCTVESSNSTPKPAIAATATTTGSVRYCSLRVASGTTYVSATTDLTFFETFGTGTDNTAGEKVGTILSGDIEGKVDVIDGYHDVPTADSTDNAQMRDVVGNKEDAAAAGAVSTTESLMAYVKQLVGGQITIDAYHDVATADAVTNAVMSDVVGNKEDAAAAGAVSTTESLMAYAKQLVGGQITIDGYHDVPTADSTDNAQARDVIGNKEDAAAAGAVSTTESLMAYAKQLVGGQIIIDGYHDVATADAATNTVMSDVIGNKTDAAVQAAATTKTITAYAKGAVDALCGTAGVATWADPAAPADTVSVAEALRWLTSRQGVRGGINPLGSVYYVAASGGDDAATGGGLDPTEPLATIAQAITNASAGDTIVLGPGTHSVDVSAAALAPLANMKFVAAVPSHGGRPTTIITGDADDGADLFTIDVDGVSFEDIRFLLVAGGTNALRLFDVAQTTAANGLSFINCEFDINDVDASGVTAINIDDATNATTGMLIKGCRFRGATATTNQAIHIDVGVGGIPSALIENNIFECGSDDADALAVNFADPGTGDKSYGWTFRNNDVIGPMDYGEDGVPIVFAGAMTEGEIVGMIRTNYFASTSATPVTQDAVNSTIVNNYVGDTGTGGTLVDPGT